MKTLLTLLSILCAVRSYGALDAAIVWEMRTTGSQTNGGGFKTGASGTDYSQQTSAQYALTGATSSGAGAVILHASAATDMVGNVCYVVSGTNFTVGWYEITAVSAGVSITVDRNCTSGVGAAGVVNVGGATKIGGTLDDDFFEAVTAGNTVWIKSGTYTMGESVNIAASAGTATASLTVVGYTTTRADACVNDNRPLITDGGSGLALNQNAAVWVMKNVRVNNNAATGCTFNSDGWAENCKFTNFSTTAGRTAVFAANLRDCEVVCQNGTAASAGFQQSQFTGCYFHDSDIGVVQSTANVGACSHCIFEGNKTAAFSTSSTLSRFWLQNCTFYGAETTPLGIGVRGTAATSQGITVLNSIFYGLSTGISIATVLQSSVVEDYNTFSNCTTARTLCNTGAHSITTAPSFTAASQITGSTATTSGSTLTQSGGSFGGVTDNVDYLRVVSGTGVTVATYLITGHTTTTLTTNNALGTSGAGNVVYVITNGHNFAIGTPLKALGHPGAFQGGLSTGYLDIGAVQRQETTGGGEHSSTFVGP